MAKVPQACFSKIFAKNHVFKLKVVKQKAIVMPKMVADLIESLYEIENRIEGDDFPLVSSNLN